MLKFSIKLATLFILLNVFSNNTFAQPSVQAKAVLITYKSITSATITWTRGNGDKCMVVVRKQSSTNSAPPASVVGFPFTASSTYGNGTSFGNGDNFLIYRGTGTSCGVYGLTPNTYYYAYVYEYDDPNWINITNINNSISADNYDPFVTLDDQPTNGATVSGVTPGYTTATININAGNGDGRMVHMRNSSGSLVYPSDGNYYSGSTVFGNGAALGGGFSMYNGTGTLVSVSNLMPATLYYVNAQEYNNGLYPTSSYIYNTRNYYLTGAYSFYTLNYAPTINSLTNMSICQNAGQQVVSLANISDGSSLENQTVTVTATSSNTSLIPNPTVTYTSPSTTGSIAFTPASGMSGTATITVSVNDGWFTNNITSVSFTVTVKAIPAAPGAVSGPNTICASGANVVYSVAPIANATGYSWYIPSGWSIVSGANTNIITVSTTANASSGYVDIYGVNNNGCGTGPWNSPWKYVTVNYQPANAVAGPDQGPLCTGNTTLTATAVGGNNVGTWAQMSGPTSVTIPPGNNISITGMQLPSSTYQFTWTVSNGGVCPPKKDTVTVVVNTAHPSCTPVADFLVNPSSYGCAGSSVQLTDNSVSANTWSWSCSPKTGVVFSPDTSAQNPTVTFTNPGTYNVTLKMYSNATMQYYTISKPVVIKTTPATPGVISGVTTTCANNPNQISYSIAAVTDADNYTWTVPSGASISTNTGTGITVIYGPSATDGNVTVTASNACGTSSASSLAITVNELPVAAGVITGPDSVCQGQNNVTYSIPAINYATSYSWTTNNIIGTTALPSITVNIPVNASNFTVWVKGSNSCGVGDSSSFDVKVKPLPSAAGGIIGQSLLTVCPVADSINYKVATIANAVTYSWNISNGGNIFYGANTDSIYVDFTGITNSGTISVRGVNGCGNGQSSSPLNISFNTLDTAYLCLVSVDTGSKHLEIYWNKPVTTEIDSFRIFRKLTSNKDTLVGTVAYSAPAYLLDTLVIDDPNTNPYEFRIAIVDTCGNEGPKGPYHESMFLTANIGVGGVINLSWNKYVGNTVNYYRVLRDSTGSGSWEVINALVPPNTSVYTDNNPPMDQSKLRYYVDVDWATTCDPNAKILIGVNTSKSNIKNTSKLVSVHTVLDNNDINIYPNPASDMLYISINKNIQNAKFEIVDELGRVVFTGTIDGFETRVDTDKLNNGVYAILVYNENVKAIKKVVIQK